MAENNEFKKILIRMKRTTGITMKKAAERLGMSYSYLSDVASGRSPFTDELRGKMIQAFGANVVNDTPNIPMMYGGGDDTPMVTLPLIPMDAIAGFPAIDNDGVSLDDCEKYAIPEFSARGAEFLVRVSGTSMLPRYNSGDLLACRRIQHMTFFQWGMVYVIDTQQGILVKRLYQCNDDDEFIMCQSENASEFPPFKLPKDEIRSVSIVVGHISLQ